MLKNPHPGVLQRRTHRCRHLLVLTHENAGAASNTVTRDPKALKIEAWTPVAPAPITSRESGADERRHASLWVQVSETWHWKLPRHAAGAHDDVRASHSRSVVALDHVRVDEAGGSGVLVDGHAGPLELVAQERVRAHLAGDLAHAAEQTPIVERGLAGADSVTPELPRLPHQPRRVGQSPHRHRPVVRSHSTEFVARDERRSSSESRRPQRGDDARRPGADHDHIEVVCACGRHFVTPPSRPAVVIGRYA